MILYLLIQKKKKKIDTLNKSIIKVKRGNAKRTMWDAEIIEIRNNKKQKT